MDKRNIPEQEDRSRREFLKKCGKYAALTAPVVAAMVAPKPGIVAASAGSTCAGGKLRGRKYKERQLIGGPTCVEE